LYVVLAATPGGTNWAPNSEPDVPGKHS